jgi:hypothetical protein
MTHKFGTITDTNIKKKKEGRIQNPTGFIGSGTGKQQKANIATIPFAGETALYSLNFKFFHFLQNSS